MKSIRLFIAIGIGKMIGFVTQAFGRGSGQAAPGLVALKIYPDLIKDLSRQIDKKVIVTATNGKTTTSQMIAQILEENCDTYVRNVSGSNLKRGIASVLLEKADYFGNIVSQYGIFEVDEAEFANVATEIKPDVIVLGNIFRDQLDRYGEIDTIAKKWQTTLEEISVKTVLVINADDPSLALIASSFRGDKIFYGIKSQKKVKGSEVEHASDSVRCFNCGQILHYKTRMFSHLGDYYCIGCNKTRPKLDVWASDIKHMSNKTCFNMYDNKTIQNMQIGIAGSYNIYNALAASIVGDVWKFSSLNTKKALVNFKPAFGRMEEFIYNDRKFKMILIKNPTGANTAVEILSKVKNKYIICSLNDNIADGTDISWIYDVDFESLGEVSEIVVMGKRKYDLALRLKYAHVQEKNIKVSDDYWKVIENMSQQKLKEDEYIYILPTYTAMLEIRKILEKKKIVEKV